MTNKITITIYSIFFLLIPCSLSVLLLCFNIISSSWKNDAIFEQVNTRDDKINGTHKQTHSRTIPLLCLFLLFSFRVVCLSKNEVIFSAMVYVRCIVYYFISVCIMEVSLLGGMGTPPSWWQYPTIAIRIQSMVGRRANGRPYGWYNWNWNESEDETLRDAGRRRKCSARSKKRQIERTQRTLEIRMQAGISLCVSCV